MNLNDGLKSSKKFSNPDILEKLIEHYGIDEVGSNFPQQVWNPKKFVGTSSFYDLLAQRQDEYYQTLSASQSSRRSVGFVNGSNSVSSHVQRSLQKYSGPLVSDSSTASSSGAKRKNPPEQVGAEPKRPKR
jgi:hypothetical protein